MRLTIKFVVSTAAAANPGNAKDDDLSQFQKKLHASIPDTLGEP
jgi:hypothetical protein